MKKEEVEKSIAESLKRVYGVSDATVTIDIGSNTWEVEKESGEEHE